MRFSHIAYGALSSAFLAKNGVNAIDLNPDDDSSIKAAAADMAYGMVSYYTGNNTGDVAGNLPDPYYWWEAGAMFGSLIDYWYYTGDDSYNEITTQALLHQKGDDDTFMPLNQSRTLGNDDQGFWGLSAMAAAECKYPNPPEGNPGWLALAQGVFNTQAARWDETSCGGGLKWQIFPFNNGYNYKNTISNGVFFNLGARLARYTGNTTYVDWAERAWEWTSKTGLMDASTYHFFDGSDDSLNCSQINHIQWTYNAGVFLYGAASLWNLTGSDTWKTRTQGVLDGIDVFFSKDVPNVMYEVACEPNGKCNVDQRSFKAYLARWMAITSKVAPWAADAIMEKLSTSAVAAAKQCNAGSDGKQCGLKWTDDGVNDGSFGVGEQMAAMGVTTALLAKNVAGPVTNSTGGISKGDPDAGASANSDSNPMKQFGKVTTGDQVGAGFVTTLVLLVILGGAWWMVSSS